jgi:hypothetical protein
MTESGSQIKTSHTRFEGQLISFVGRHGADEPGRQGTLQHGKGNIPIKSSKIFWRAKVRKHFFCNGTVLTVVDYLLVPRRQFTRESRRPF